MNSIWIKILVLIIFFISCSNNQFDKAYQVANKFVAMDKIPNGTYFVIMQDGAGCESCNTHFIAGINNIKRKKNLILITDIYNLPNSSNIYIDSLDLLRSTDLGFSGTALLLKNGNSFNKVLSFGANTLNKLDSIIETIE